MSETKLSDLSAGDKVYCGLNIYTIKRVTPTGRIVTTAKNITGEPYDETWKPNGNLMGADMWNSRSIKPLTEEDRERIMARRNLNRMLQRLEKETWRFRSDSEISQIFELLESFDEVEA